MANRRRWIPIVVGVVVLLGFVAVGAVVFGVAWVRQNLDVEEVAETDATAAFAEIQQKFASKPPLITFQGGVPHSDKAALDGRPRTSLNTMHVLAWEPRDGQLARFTIPFWLLRLKETPIRFGSYASGADSLGIQLRASDIERYGAGIVVDATLPRGSRALIWVD